MKSFPDVPPCKKAPSLAVLQSLPYCAIQTPAGTPYFSPPQFWDHPTRASASVCTVLTHGKAMPRPSCVVLNSWKDTLHTLKSSTSIRKSLSPPALCLTEPPRSHPVPPRPTHPLPCTAAVCSVCLPLSAWWDLRPRACSLEACSKSGLTT